jgi:hypothetical protein
MTKSGETTVDLTSNIIDSVIAAAAVVALFFSAKTLNDSRRTSKDARDQAESTAKLAKSAADQLEQQRLSLAASIQPAVIDVGQDFQKLITGGPALDPDRDISVIDAVDPGGRKIVLITVPVRNVGSGPAFVSTTRVWVQREVVTGEEGRKVAAGDETDASVTQRVLNAGETMQVRAAALPSTPGEKVLRRLIDLRANFMLYVRYADLAGRRFQSELLIHAIEYHPAGDPDRSDFRYMPVRVRLHECGPDWKPVGKPFAYSGGPEDEDDYVVTGPEG